ncbi:MAG: glycosyltransferase [Candidatus Eisenbacteria bacterium]
MRVMHVVEAMHQGGAETLVVEHVRLAGPEVESTVVALNRGGPSLEAARAAGAEAVLMCKGEARLAALHKLGELMKQRRIQVVNGHNPTGAMYATLAARMAGVPVVVRTEHSIHYPGRGFRFYGPVEALITTLSDRVICVCEASRLSHTSRLRFAQDRFVTILNGIAEPAVAPRERESTRAALGLAPDARLVLNVGSLTRQKSQDTLLRAFARMAPRVPQAVLCIVGEGVLEPRLRALHAELGLGERARFLGPRTDVPDLMEACDLFALASSREGLSITLLEAMRASRACLATQVGGNAEAVADDTTGRIVPVGDVERMAAAFAELLGDSTRLTAFGQAGHARWRERFTAHRMVRQTEALYGEALARHGHPRAEAARESA